MLRYLVMRLGLFIPALLGLTVLVFVLVRLLPGDFAVAMMEQAGSTAEVELMSQKLGLDRPWVVQYGLWFSGILRGDFGISFWSQESVLSEILRRMPVTIELAVLSLLVSVLIAVPLGVLATQNRGRWPDFLARFLSFMGLSVPHFWMATLVLIYSAAWFKWIPPLSYTPFLESPTKNLAQFVVPALVLGIHLAARTLRMTRSALIEALSEDYVRTARAKGLGEGRVLWKHALRNALIPVVTVIGTQFSYLLGGTVIIESIFAMPGLGRLMVDSIGHRDYPQLQGNVLVIGVLVLTVNLLVDLTYSWIDPRISQGGRGAVGSGGH